MANILKREKQEMILKLLVEGNSVRSTSRLTGAHVKTILDLLVRVGEACERVHDETMRDLPCEDIQLDEIWCFVAKKQRHLDQGDPTEWGDAYTFTALDRKTKLIAAYTVGKRDGWNAASVLLDLQARLAPRARTLLSSDGFEAYPNAVEGAFGSDADYGMIVKDYGSEDAGRGRYSPPKVLGVEKLAVSGHPDLDRICTSHVERQNLTMRMMMRRFTRLTNAFSKKLRNLRAAVALYFAYYNLCRVHQTLRVTPAMEAGVTDRIWTVGDLLDAADRREPIAVAA
mgnify:CR=1 FL=1